jgi:hypothetical protein
MADPNSNNRKQGSERTNLSEQSMRSLSNSVGSLAQQVRNLSTQTARQATRGAMSVTGSAARSVGGAAYDMRSDFGLSVSKSVGLGVASAVNPFAGELIRRIVEKNQGTLGNSMRSMVNSSKSMLATMKTKMAAKPKEITDSRASMTQLESLKKARRVKADMAAGIVPRHEGSRRKGKRLTPNSYTNMYGSDDHIEALDRLRISNAEWLKAVGSLPKEDLKKKPLPKAEQGGLVKKTGRAIVHEGEAIIPADALVGQYKVLKDMREHGKLQNEHLQKMSTALGQQDSLLMKGIEAAIGSGLKNNPGMQAISQMTLGMSKILVDYWRFKTVSGPGGKFARLVIRKSPLETTAEATAQTYGELRYSFGIVHKQLNELLRVQGGAQQKLPEELKILQGSGPINRFKRFLLTGEVAELFRGSSHMETAKAKISGAVGGVKSKISGLGSEGGGPGLFSRMREGVGNRLTSTKEGLSTMWGDAKAQAAARSMINSKGDKASAKRGIRSLITTSPAHAMTISVITAMSQKISGIGNSIKEFVHKDNVEDREELTFRQRMMAWLRINKIRGLADDLIAWGAKYLIPAVTTVGGVISGILTTAVGALGLTAGGKFIGFGNILKRIDRGPAKFVKGGRFLPGGGRAAKGGQMVFGESRTARLLTNAKTYVRNSVGRMAVSKTALNPFNAATATGGADKSLAYRAGNITGKSIRGAKSAADATKTGVSGMVAALKKVAPSLLRGLGATAKIAGRLAIPVLIVLSIIDGIMGWFKAGKIFDVAEPTIRQRTAAMAGSVVAGLLEIIRLPINLVLKLLGKDERIPSLVKPLAKFFDDVIGVVQPLIQGIMANIKFMFKYAKLAIGNMVALITFFPRLLMDPKKTIVDAIDRIKRTALFFIDDLPNHVGKILGFAVDAFFKFAELGNKFVVWGREKLADIFYNIYVNWKSFGKEVLAKGQSMIFGAISSLLTGVINVVKLGKNFLLDSAKKIPGIGRFIKDSYYDYIDERSDQMLDTYMSSKGALGSARSEVGAAASQRGARISGMLGGVMDQLGIDRKTSSPRFATGASRAGDVAKSRAKNAADSERRTLEKQDDLTNALQNGLDTQTEQMIAIQNSSTQQINNNTNSVQNNGVGRPQSSLMTGSPLAVMGVGLD